MKTRHTVLSIAGYDPSGGAGLLADIKTFENNKVYGIGVMTANTWQNESEFEKTEWLTSDKILSQLEILFRKSEVEYCKIGLIENADTFTAVIKYLKEKKSKIRIIWDPVLKASAGFDFHSASALEAWTANLPDLYLITPNWQEAQWLSGIQDGNAAGRKLSEYCHVYLKGGHHPSKPGYDYLYQHSSAGEEKSFTFRPKVKDVPPKHGSGCVFSSALTSFLAKDFPLKKAAMLSKNYITRYLQSTPGLLGYHKY